MMSGRAEWHGESDHDGVALPASFPYVDAETAYLAQYVQWWRRYYKLVQGAKTAGRPASEIAHLQKLEQSTRRAVKKGLRAHPLWPWLEQFPGLGGGYTAYIVQLIKDPRRFPGQRCAKGHYVPAIFQGGAPCPIEGLDESEKLPERCGAPLQNRRGTGVRSLWHYFGLHVIDGKRARKRRGKQADWVTEAPGLLLGPQGIADQIIIGRVEPYRSKYDLAKVRIADERGVLDGGDRAGAEASIESESRSGSARSPNKSDGPEVERLDESEGCTGLRPVQIHTIARTIALKAFVGDLLIAWKGLV